MGLGTMIKKGASKVANGVANQISEASKLSEKQLEKCKEKSKEYLALKPDMTSDESQEKTRRLLGTIGVAINHAYLSELNTIYTPMVSVPANYATQNRIAYFDISKWVLDVDENYLDKLVNVYHVLSQENCNIALIFHRSTNDCKITMAVVNNAEKIDRSIVDSYNVRLQEAVMGNFPGVVFEETNGAGIPPCLDFFEYDKDGSIAEIKTKNIATITNVATEKSEKFISQSIEKLLNGVVPLKNKQEYTLVLLASPSRDFETKQSFLHEIYSSLTPFASWQTNYTFSESESQNSSFSAGVNLGVSVGASASLGVAESLAKTVTNAVSAGSADGTLGASRSVGRTEGSSTTQTTGANAGANFGVNFNRSSSININIAKNEGITQNFTNHQVKHTLEMLDKHMKRLEQGKALGMWNFAAYVVSDDYNITNNVAHMYLALTQGEESFISQSAINTWHSNLSDETQRLLWEISHLQHPIFCLKDNLEDQNWLMYPVEADATTTISGRELAYAFNLPRKSVAGFPVIECAEFGRNVVTYDASYSNSDTITLGNVFHMHHDENNHVKLSLNSLTSHTFITGSTGSGKSNTVYRMIGDLKDKGIPFLVIEPAKGEYKHVFGKDKEEVSVYGTNPSIMPLLRLNPFSFPEGIHILEHLDRLVEIFNVCWPMYAAMPAVLKNAVEKAYEDCGWNLADSSNPYGKDMYPTFADVARNVKTIIDSSDYDAENGLSETLSLLCEDDELDRKFLVIKDAHLYFDDPKVVTCLKSIALRISQGIDAVVIIVSSVLKFPKELEKFITILEMDYPTQNEIKAQITAFADEQSVTITEELLEDMSMAFKGLTEFEIENLLAAALADDGMFTRSDLKLIFDQKQQMIMKSGIRALIRARCLQDCSRLQTESMA